MASPYLHFQDEFGKNPWWLSGHGPMCVACQVSLHSIQGHWCPEFFRDKRFFHEPDGTYIVAPMDLIVLLRHKEQIFHYNSRYLRESITENAKVPYYWAQSFESVLSASTLTNINVILCNSLNLRTSLDLKYVSHLNVDLGYSITRRMVRGVQKNVHVLIHLL